MGHSTISPLNPYVRLPLPMHASYFLCGYYIVGVCDRSVVEIGSQFRCLLNRLGECQQWLAFNPATDCWLTVYVDSYFIAIFNRVKAKGGASQHDIAGGQLDASIL